MASKMTVSIPDCIFAPWPAIGSFCIAIDEWCQGTSAGQQQHARGYDPKASKFVL
jgi:hypothetical protein